MGPSSPSTQALDINPSAETYIMLGLVYQKMHNTTAAKSCFAKAANLDPADQVAQQLVQDPGLASKIAGVDNQ